MELTILGCSGSVAAPGNAASGYLITVDNAPAVVMDLGPGTFAPLQELANPSEADVVFTHLHADHCLDLPSLLVWRRFHPELAAKGRNLCFGPERTPVHLGRLSANGDEVDDFSDTLAFAPWRHGQTEILGKLNFTPYEVDHPVEAYAFRVEHTATGSSLCYSGDTAYTENLIEAARGVDYFFCEAGWGPDGNDKPIGMHMSGGDCGRAAREAGVGTLVLVHIQPWADKEATLEAARAEFDGEIIVGEAGMEFEI
ncbi:hypothetical protein C3B44_09475 [Corynebacterium yudongzhengii]|uniref:Metallo-beta-lactamase domain-containing protein n=1 Tax=Corynebacterium yudongzhengii TaxID=2080740 RepID=A0A2U1T9G3_9CORY|nr:MBL fold metallo-hydrolase [Corynebacterium yudongzhengii]AWB83029.1 hypothetical protein C3B44_09475 [Corynebacterium yudongzhengii]PWC02518.1 hypothetical protein DF222_01795 [Corynebacterium yudongzhengii]